MKLQFNADATKNPNRWVMFADVDGEWLW